MINNQFNNKDNNYNNTNNFSHIRSNYINPNTQKVNNNLFQNQQSFNINNTNNSVAFNSPLSTNINFNNISQRQFDNSSNFSKPYEDFSKTLSSQTVDTSINHRDSKAVKIKKITKKPISKPISSIFNPTTNYNTNNNINRNIDNNNLRNKENKVNMKRNNNQNIVNKKPVIQSNIKNNNNINNNVNKNKDEDSDDSSDYGNAEDDDFEYILRESISIRDTQNMMNYNNNNSNIIKDKNNPFSKNKNEVSQPIKNLKEKNNIINKNISQNINNNSNVIKNKLNNNINKINNNINNNIVKNQNKINKINPKIKEDKSTLVNHLQNLNSLSDFDNIKDKTNTIINDNLEKINPIKGETENKDYNTMNNNLDKMEVESDKIINNNIMDMNNIDLIDKSKDLNNKLMDMNNIDLIDKSKDLKNNNIINENLGKIKDNLNMDQNCVELKDYFNNDNNQEHKDNFLNNNNINFDNIYNMNNIIPETNNLINNNLNDLNIENDFFNNNINDDDDNNNINENINNNINDNINNDGINNIINNNINDKINDNINDNLNDINQNNLNNEDINNINNNKHKNEELISSDTPVMASKINLENPQIKNQFINHNISIDSALKQNQFLERLKSISNTRYSYFIKKYQKDNYFMEKDQFENIFIDEKNLQVQSPLTLIFHYIFNPDTPIPESGKSFFETIFTKRGDQNYIMSYDKSELIEIPKFFDNFTYINNLFNTFDIEKLNNFLEEINNWKETFSFEQHFVHPLYMFKKIKSITMKDIATVYFISPHDLIIDYHSYGSDLPLSDTFVCITQYRFHCDIYYDIKKGKFIFKTRGQIYNTLRFIKETLLKKTIRSESNNTNKEELQVNTWSPLKSVIESEDKKNQKIAEQVYEQYLLNNLNKYSNEVPKEYDILYGDKDDNWDSFSDLDNKEENTYKKDEDNFFDEFKENLDDRNFILLKYVAIFIIFLLVSKILWAIGNGTISFGTIFNSLIVFLLGYLLIKFS